MECKRAQKVDASDKKIPDPQNNKIPILQAGSWFPYYEKYYICNVDTEQLYYCIKQEIIAKAN